MTDRELFKQALDALQASDAVFYPQTRLAIAALRERLARTEFDSSLGQPSTLHAQAKQPEQEPVAWGVFASNGNVRLWSQDREAVRAFAERKGLPLAPLYAAPQPQRKPLTDWIAYDADSDVLTILGKRYAAALFGERGFLSPVGTVLRIESGRDDVVTVRNVTPAVREWVSLTDEEISDITFQLLEKAETMLTFARAIEAALRARNAPQPGVSE